MKYQGLVNISLTTEIHTIDENGVTNPALEYKNQYGKASFFKVEADSIEKCQEKLQILLNKIGELLTNEQKK